MTIVPNRSRPGTKCFCSCCAWKGTTDQGVMKMDDLGCTELHCPTCDELVTIPSDPSAGGTYERPCGCPTNTAGRAQCEERSGSPGTYCLHERQLEAESADNS
jgi:hypothetical protein